jgi:hypothetical protein
MIHLLLAFPVHLPACCMINSCPAFTVRLLAFCMIYFLPCPVSKEMHKWSDIEAKDRKETKTFWCVPKFFFQNRNVSIYSKNF